MVSADKIHIVYARSNVIRFYIALKIHFKIKKQFFEKIVFLVHFTIVKIYQKCLLKRYNFPDFYCVNFLFPFCVHLVTILSESTKTKLRENRRTYDLQYDRLCTP